MAELKRLNFFTGFFTTAEDWTAEQEYHIAVSRLLNRGLHTPGLLRGELGELAVRAAPKGLRVRVRPGAALDAAGRLIYLARAEELDLPAGNGGEREVYVSIRYREVDDDFVEYVDTPEYNDFTRIAERPELRAEEVPPNNTEWLELARIGLPAGADSVAGADVDRSGVLWAGAEIDPSRLVPEDLRLRLVELMQRTRRDYGALDGRFPVPAADDVRHAALTVEIQARTGNLFPQRLPSVLEALAAVENDVAQELGALHTVLATTTEYQNYLAAVTDLEDGLRAGRELDELLTLQDRVAQRARELAEVVITAPQADAGADLRVEAVASEATVTLDVSGSRAFGGRRIETYGWSVVRSETPPVADIDVDVPAPVTVRTAGDEAVVTLDASGSRAGGGRTIVRYRWTLVPTA
jgi:hypothetical protein